MIQNFFFFFFFFFIRGMGSLSQPGLNIFTVDNMGVMICLGQGGLCSLSASSYVFNHYVVFFFFFFFFNSLFHMSHSNTFMVHFKPINFINFVAYYSNYIFCFFGLATIKHSSIQSLLLPPYFKQQVICFGFLHVSLKEFKFLYGLNPFFYFDEAQSTFLSPFRYFF